MQISKNEEKTLAVLSEASKKKTILNLFFLYEERKNSSRIKMNEIDKKN